ncbi:hypothetical protein ACFL9T_06915 [Thermodesulfobacteriota bacterium]
MANYKTILWGTGVLGSQVARVLSMKSSVQLTGGIVHSSDKAGQDLGKICGVSQGIGVETSNDAKKILNEVEADVALIATQASKFFRGSYEENLAQILLALEAKKNVITTTGFLYPWKTVPDIAEKIDSTAKKNGVTFFGTGLNPGFLSDTLILFLTGPLVRIDRIKVRDMEDMTMYNSVPILRDMLGYGLTPEAFQAGAAQRFTDYMTDLYTECIHFVTDPLGVEDIEIRADLQSFTTAKTLKTVCTDILPGTIASHVFVVEGLIKGESFMTIDYGAKVCPDDVPEGGPLGQTIEIEGRPSVKFDLQGDLVERGILSTAGQVINAIPHVVAAPPGIITRRELPIFSPIR